MEPIVIGLVLTSLVIAVITLLQTVLERNADRKTRTSHKGTPRGAEIPAPAYVAVGSSTKTVDLLCLANSRKDGGRCIAGVRLDDGGWLRPVGSGAHGALVPRDYLLPVGGEPRVLDIFG